MKYEVSLEYLYHTTIEVDAESFDDAVEKAKNAPLENVFPSELEDPTPTYVHREDGKEKYDF